jgi:hypothetical protein
MSSEPVIHLDAETLLPVGVSVPCPARIDGRCPVCDSDIFVEQLIVHTTEDRFVHALCVAALGGAR